LIQSYYTDYSSTTTTVTTPSLATTLLDMEAAARRGYTNIFSTQDCNNIISEIKELLQYVHLQNDFIHLFSTLNNLSYESLATNYARK